MSEEVNDCVDDLEPIELDEVDAYPPWNFSWIVENKLAIMAWPQNKENIKFLVDEGIRHLISLSPERLPPVTIESHLEWTIIPIDEFESPTIKDVNRFIDICQRCHKQNQVILFRFY